MVIIESFADIRDKSFFWKSMSSSQKARSKPNTVSLPVHVLLSCFVTFSHQLFDSTMYSIGVRVLVHCENCYLSATLTTSVCTCTVYVL